MSSSAENARSTIMQWSDKGTSLDFNFTGLGTVIIEFDVRVKLLEASDGVIVTKPSDPFECRFKLLDWTLSLDNLPDGRRSVRMRFGKGKSVLALTPRPPAAV